MTAGAVLEAVRERYGWAIRWEGPCPGGEVGAHYARASDGRRLVFKWVEDRDRLDQLTEVVERIERLRAKGYPAPRYHPPVVVSGGIVLFQDAVEGHWRDEVDQALVDEVLRVIELQAGEGDGSGRWSEYIARTLIEGADGYCLHQTLQSYSDQTRQILDRVQATGASLGALPGSDLVHLDFHHRNLLRVDGRLNSVVDLEGCQPGDRVFDLVTFSFGFTHARGDLNLEAQVWERAQQLGSAERLAAYVAHISLRRLDWTIRHHSAGDVAHLLEFIKRYDRRLT